MNNDGSLTGVVSSHIFSQGYSLYFILIFLFYGGYGVGVLGLGS